MPDNSDNVLVLAEAETASHLALWEASADEFSLHATIIDRIRPQRDKFLKWAQEHGVPEEEAKKAFVRVFLEQVELCLLRADSSTYQVTTKEGG